MARIYVGNLPDVVRERDLSDLFERYGRLTSVQIKFPVRPPPFAFLTYDTDRHASDAVRAMHNTMLSGSRLRVEMSRNPVAKRPHGSQYRVTLAGLPDTMSWQDLKDFLRRGGDVVHAAVDRRGHGSASFATLDERRRAIRRLNGVELEGECIQMVPEEDDARDCVHSRSRSPHRRYRSRSPRRTSRTHGRDRSRSRSR